ncbi:MAG: XRE family transcriptional regulator [Gemmatimonadaceae bacterium]|nr:XRE family transcriptional regulator [Gemmatimonadaceae bacterium]MCW5826748.1 XRE family transcriptional regulator [Gemmatimonadaceae bacterium]
MSLKPLQLLREARAVTQASVAAAMRLTQPAVSKLERRADVSVRALRDYIAALGGTLEVTAKFTDGAVPLLDADETYVSRVPLRKVAERRPAWGNTLPPDWIAEIERVRRLTPEDRLEEAAELSAFLAETRRV